MKAGVLWMVACIGVLGGDAGSCADGRLRRGLATDRGEWCVLCSEKRARGSGLCGRTPLAMAAGRSDALKPWGRAHTKGQRRNTRVLATFKDATRGRVYFYRVNNGGST
jgi:hypothetical protein